MSSRRLPLLSATSVLLLLAACGGKEEDAADEGTAAGDCRDGADNDADGLFDCDDDGCAASPDCEGADENAAPSGAAIAIEPATPGDDDDLTCTIVTEATDPNGDAVSYAFAWSRNGADAGVSSATVGAALTSGGDTWTCTVTPNDGTLDGAVSTASVTIAQGNRAPSAPTVSISPAAPTDDDVLTCVIDTESVDPDGDTVTYAYAWSVDGADAGISSATVDSALTEPEQAWTCVVTASDGELETSSASASVEIGAGCVPGDAACPASSCLEILEAGVGTSGEYWIETDSGSAQVACDMDTDGGGWTRVWAHDGVTDYNSSTLPYDISSSSLLGTAVDVLVGYIDSSDVLDVYWASFAIPEAWRYATPMTEYRVDTSVDALISGTRYTGVGLHYGYSDWTYGGADCSTVRWISAQPAYGVFCLENANAPWFSGFAGDTSWSGTDYCSLGVGDHGATNCSSSRRFAIFVR